MRGASCRFVFRPGNTTEESALVEGLIQTIAERQGHGRRGRVGGRFPVAPGSRPGGPGAAQEGRVACAEHGVVVAQVPWAEPGSRFTRDFEMERAWLTAVASRKTVGGFLRIEWRTAGDIARRVAARLGSSAVHVRRSHRDRRGRDQLQEGAHVHHRGRRPQAQTGRLGARRVRQGGPRPVLPTADRRAARLHQGGHRRRRQMDRRQREGAPAERRARARLVPHRLLDDRHARPGQETVVEPGPARQRQDSHGDDERPEIRRAPRTPAT